MQIIGKVVPKGHGQDNVVCDVILDAPDVK